MTPFTKKILFTVLIIVVFVLGFCYYMYIRADSDKYVPLFMGLIFAIIPAILINNIWNKESKEKKN